MPLPVANQCKTVVQKLHKYYTTLMLTDTTAVRSYFGKLGLETEIADIYLALHANGPQTISALARSSGVERTRIYRLIDRLLETNLIEVETGHKRGIIKAAPIANLHILITQKGQELKSLQDELELIEQVLARNSLSNPATRVQFYHGAEGIRQMQWNLFQAKTELLSIRHEPMHMITGETSYKRWAEKWNAGGYSCRIILDTHFLKLSNAWYAKNQQTRALSPSVMPITYAADIYNDVIAYYNWHEGEVYGIEIYNKQITDAQRVFYEMLWKLAAPRSKLQ
jgi:sugar-specific transcriptional regulator TrmB